MKNQITNNFYIDELFINRNEREVLEALKKLNFKKIFHFCTILEILRLKINEPINIISWYRSTEANEKAGGIKDSLHLLGLAIDCHVKNNSKMLRELINLKSSNKFIDFYFDEKKTKFHIEYEG